jgi:hypothetical protein
VKNGANIAFTIVTSKKKNNSRKTIIFVLGKTLNNDISIKKYKEYAIP